MKTMTLTCAQALVNYLASQYIVVNHQDIQNKELPLFGCAFSIFGHGNVTCLGQELKTYQDVFPTWRGQNEQSMAMAAIAFARANQRQRIGIATSSIGPGATNMVTAAGVAHTNRLPLLLLSGDTFLSRLPDPVLQQTEHFHDPTLTVNDAFKSVCRYWDRITHPAQLLSSLPQAIAMMLDPSDAGPAFIGLPQDVQGMAWEFPTAFFDKTVHRIARPLPELTPLNAVVAAIKNSKRPLIISGGGVIYSQSQQELALFASKCGIPVSETIAGRSGLLADHSMNIGPIGTSGADAVNQLACRADLVIAIGTRLQDFTTASWSAFAHENMQLICINTCRLDVIKHRALSLQSDAKEAITALSRKLEKWTTSTDWQAQVIDARKTWHQDVTLRCQSTKNGLPTYAQVVGVVNRLVDPTDRIISAAGGLPGEINMNWQASATCQLDIEYGFSCMGYEIAAGWGVKIARPEHDSIVLVGDGSYLMLNSDIYSSVLSGHKMIIIVCDNGGFAVINRLQVATGNDSFNNLLVDCTHQRRNNMLPRVDFVQHAQSLGAKAEKVLAISDFPDAFARAKAADLTYVLVIDIDPVAWSENAAWWEVGLPDVCHSAQHQQAVADWQKGKANQRKGI